MPLAGLTNSSYAHTEITGNFLYTMCIGKTNDAVTGAGNLFCLGYVDAVTEALTGAPVAGKRACIPRGVDENQTVDISTSYIKAHPESRHLAAYALISRAFAEAFPCPQK